MTETPWMSDPIAWTGEAQDNAAQYDPRLEAWHDQHVAFQMDAQHEEALAENAARGAQAQEPEAREPEAGT